MTIEVRRITADDGAALKQVRLAALLDAPSAFGSTHAVEAARPDREWDAAAARSAAGDDSARFLACDGDDVVGIVGIYREGGREPELVSMWTAPAARRRGAARALVDAALDWAWATGADAVSLWVTRGNEGAQALYESMGFQVTGDHQPLPSDPCKDEIRMRCNLLSRSGDRRV